MKMYLSFFEIENPINGIEIIKENQIDFME